MTRNLRLDLRGSTASVTLDRPRARIAMSAELMREMIRCARQLGERRELDAVIVRGAGKWFSAGADLKDAARWGNRSLPLDEQREVARSSRGTVNT